jgi:preprotein translocase subunit SecA
MRHWLSELLGRPVEFDLSQDRLLLAPIDALESGLGGLSDAELAGKSQMLKRRVQDGTEPSLLVAEAFALSREAARRAIGQRPFDVQILAGLAMHRGRIAELATGEGKTLAAVATAYLHALVGRGVHVLTFNDYLARRDARWMGPVYQRLGMSVGYVQEGMMPAERRRAYRCDVTYVTAKEAGFDYLRDGLALDESEQVHRPFHFAIVDEADSILIDEARIPLVIAGTEAGQGSSPVGLERMAAVARQLRPGIDYDTDEHQHNIALTEAGTARAETLLGCGDLYASENLARLAQLRNALHAQCLLARDVDYVVRGGKVELVDDFTGRVADKRQWPDGLQAALEAKEGVRRQPEGRILGSVTLQHFLKQYPHLAGMTATAQPAAEELEQVYGLRVAVVPTNRPMIRVDLPDVVFTHQDAKRAALLDEIAAAHGTGRPVLVGTATVGESERLADELRAKGVPCEVLNAKNDEREAEIVARAGALGAVTISTNMAGRGTDIRLGGPEEDAAQRAKVVALGGLYVIGTSRHASLRIDQQLRGRAGRQGDPGRSRFFVSLEDDLIRRYGVQNLIFRSRGMNPRSLFKLGGLSGPPRPPTRWQRARGDEVEGKLLRTEIARAQRIIESETYETRKTLYAFSEPVEAQRQAIRRRRQEALERAAAFDRLAELCPERYASLRPRVGETVLREVERRLSLVVIDRCWSEYLVEVGEMRDDSHLLAFAGRVPLSAFIRQVGVAFMALEERIDEEMARIFEALEVTPEGVDWEAARLRGPSATWTYLVGENPFGVSGYAGPVTRSQLSFAVVLLWPLVLISGLAHLWKRRRRPRAESQVTDPP